MMRAWRGSRPGSPLNLTKAQLGGDLQELPTGQLRPRGQCWVLQPSRGWTFALGILWRRPGTAKRSTLHGTAPLPDRESPPPYPTQQA